MSDHMGSWHSLTKEEKQAELIKCKEDPKYFYNTYCKVLEAPDLTDEDWEKKKALFMADDAMARSLFTLPDFLKTYPITCEEAFKPNK